MSEQDPNWIPLDSHLRSLARALIQDAASADDVVQEAWAEYLRRPRGEVRHPRAWLRTATRRIASRGRALGERGNPGGASRLGGNHPEPFDTAPEPEEQAQRVEWSLRLHSHLDALPTGQGEVLRLRFLEDLTIEEVAARLEIPEGTAKSRTHHGLRSLKERLDREFRGSPHWCLGLLPCMGAGTKESLAATAASGHVAGSRLPLYAAISLVALAGLVGLFTEFSSGPSERVATLPMAEPTPYVGQLMRGANSSASPRAPTETPPPAPVASTGEAPEQSAWGELTVSVVDDAGLPLRAAEVFFVDRDMESHSLGLTDRFGITRATIQVEDCFSKGTEEESSARPATLLLYPQLRGRARVPMTDVEFPRHTHLELELALPLPGVDFSGLVHDRQGESIVGLELVAVRPPSVSNKGERTKQTDAWAVAASVSPDGRFEVLDWPPGALTLEASGPGMIASERHLEITGPGPFVIEEPWILDRGASVEGQVLNPGGMGCAEAEVAALVGPNARQTWAATDADGGFRLTGLAPGEHLLVVRKMGVGSREVAQVHLSLKAEEQAIWSPVLGPAEPYGVELYNEAGQPLVSWNVQFSTDSKPSSRAYSVRTGADGIAQLPFDLGGAVRAYIYPPRTEGLRSLHARHVAQDVAAGPSLRRIVLGPKDLEGATLHGSLTGSFTSGWRVLCLPTDHRNKVILGVHPTSGQFESEGLTPGRMRLVLDAGPLGLWSLGACQLEAGEVTRTGPYLIPAPGTLELVRASDSGEANAASEWLIAPTGGKQPMARPQLLEAHRPLQLFPGVYRVWSPSDQRPRQITIRSKSHTFLDPMDL